MIEGLLEAHRAGWALERPFYRDATIHAFEEQHLFPRQWMVIAHVSELPQRGAHIVRSLFGQDIIVVNAGDQGYRAFHNVCTHRGSRICKEDGRGPLLVCPYHAWSFKLTGELQSTRDLPDGVDPATLGLHPVACRAVAGLILCGLDEASLPDLAPLEAAMAPAMRHHGFDRAKVAAHRSYPTSANWKLVLENFLECYHCRPSHPEYFRMNGHVAVSAMTDPAAGTAWLDHVAQWKATQADTPVNRETRVPGGLDEVHLSLYRQPIGLDRQTASQSGLPVAPLMGGFDRYDGGETGLHFGMFSFAGAYNDHIVLFRFMPRGPTDTDVLVTWLVDQDADLSAIDLDALTFMWDVTTRQDKVIVEDNAIGIASPAYRPGPYTALEAQTSAFVCDYVAMLQGLLSERAPPFHPIRKETLPT
jgi:Rieske 2Fe-2S family protein